MPHERFESHQIGFRMQEKYIYMLILVLVHIKMYYIYTLQYIIVIHAVAMSF